MFELEILVFIFSIYQSVRFLSKWSASFANIWPPERKNRAKKIFAWLPLVACAVILFTLRTLASFDVVDDFFYLLFYLLLGLAWLRISLSLMSYCFDLSWIDDALNLNNDAALWAIAGGGLGATMIYAGANIGDGPGWWCVVFAGGLGLSAWIILGRRVNRYAEIFERITVERDLSCGVRFGGYLLGSGIILGRASAGDWTSFAMTLIEFLDGWPSLLLTVLAVAVERSYMQKRRARRRHENDLPSSVCWGLIFVFAAIAAVTLLPELRENPFYSGAAGTPGMSRR